MAAGAAQAFRHPRQDAIAGDMAVAVVVRLEVVHIQRYQRQRVAQATALGRQITLLF